MATDDLADLSASFLDVTEGYDVAGFEGSSTATAVGIEFDPDIALRLEREFLDVSRKVVDEKASLLEKRTALRRERGRLRNTGRPAVDSGLVAARKKIDREIALVTSQLEEIGVEERGVAHFSGGTAPKPPELDDPYRPGRRRLKLTPKILAAGPRKLTRRSPKESTGAAVFPKD